MESQTPSTEPKPVSNWWSTVNQVLGSIKTTSETIVETYKKDLTEFVEVVAKESQSGVQLMKDQLKSTLISDEIHQDDDDIITIEINIPSSKDISDSALKISQQAKQQAGLFLEHINAFVSDTKPTEKKKIMYF